jgi:hypothetical protein
MKRTYYLIKNTSGYTYWSYRLTYRSKKDITEIERRAIERHGIIYVNRNGGWMTKDNVDKILKTVVAENFPNETED